MKNIYKFFNFLILGILFSALTFAQDYRPGIVILNEGQYMTNNASVSFLSEEGEISNGIFTAANPGVDLGDTAQGMGFEGDNAYIVLNGSHTIRVVDRNSFELITTIDEGLENPRYIAFSDGRGYVTNWGDAADTEDDFVAVINLETNEVESTISVSEGPEKIIEVDGKLYVTQQGGWGYGNTVSVIDLSNNSVSEIEVADVPLALLENDGFLYVISGGKQAWTGDETDAALFKIDLTTNAVVDQYDFATGEHPGHLGINEDLLYFVLNGGIYTIDFNASTVAPELLVQTDVTVSYGFNVIDGKIYIADAKDYVTDGDVHVYSLLGDLEETYLAELLPNGFYKNEAEIIPDPEFAGGDVKFIVGEGTEISYLVVDFKDETDDRSYAWGFRYNEGESLTFADMLIAIDEAEPNFTHETGFGGAFLNDIVFNSHSGINATPDYWSTWSGNTSETMSMNAGISEALQNERWYGASYGFSNPSAQHPVTPIPAYHSLWFDQEDIVTWIGEGENQSIVIVDFGTDTDGEADSFAFGFRYDEASISVADAMDLLENSVVSFEYTIDSNQVSEIYWNGYTGTATVENPWKAYTGTDLSNWVTATDLSAVSLENGEWLGFSFGDRRPFIPTDEAEVMNVIDHSLAALKVYPNPASDIFYIDSDKVSQIEIYDLSGKLVKATQKVSNGISVNELNSGIYIVKIYTGKNSIAKKLIIK